MAVVSLSKADKDEREDEPVLEGERDEIDGKSSEIDE